MKKIVFCVTILLTVCIFYIAYAVKYKTSLSYESKCNAFGAETYLVNSDSEHAYKVTVLTRWTERGQSRSSTREYDVSAGGKTYVACSYGVDRTTQYTRTITGEVLK